MIVVRIVSLNQLKFLYLLLIFILAIFAGQDVTVHTKG